MCFFKEPRNSCVHRRNCFPTYSVQFCVRVAWTCGSTVCFLLPLSSLKIMYKSVHSRVLSTCTERVRAQRPRGCTSQYILCTSIVNVYRRSTVRVRALYCTPYIPRTVRVRLNSCVHRWNCFLFPLSSSKTILPVYTWVSGFLPIQYNYVYE